MTPNVIAAALPEEIDALNARYGEVEQMCAQVWHIILDFQKHVEAMARITINLAFDTVYCLVARGEFYENYYERRSKDKDVQYDTDREATETFLFGEYKHLIRCGALCSLSTGLLNYGEFCIVLNSEVWQECASVFEENPFVFFRKYPYIPMEKPPVQYGYRATWENRSKLAVAKLGRRMTEMTQSSDFPSILTYSANATDYPHLSRNERKMQDDFIEVHICKEITCDDIVEVRAPKNPTLGNVKAERAEKLTRKDVIRTSKLIVKLGKKWTTY